MTDLAALKASRPMMAATLRSGQPCPEPKNPTAASMTATFPSASLRLQSLTERLLSSPSR